MTTMRLNVRCKSTNVNPVRNFIEGNKAEKGEISNGVNLLLNFRWEGNIENIFSPAIHCGVSSHSFLGN